MGGGFEYEFGGPVGALVTTLVLPVIVLFLGHCARVGAVDLRFYESMDVSGGEIGAACATLVAWFGFQVVLERTLPGMVVAGTKIRDGTTLMYNINGHLAFWVTVLCALVAWPSWAGEHVVFGAAPLHALYTNWFALALAAIGLCFALSAWLYVRSADPTKLRAVGGDSGVWCYDFFMGRELNPRTLSFDWKCFCELRPGLIGWVLFNAGFMVLQAQRLGYVTGSMILVNAFQGIYVWDALYQERAILTTMDITTDGFGYMLVFGDLCWVPFTYSLQANYLAAHDPELGPLALALICSVNFLGYYMFRSANSEKDAFRRNPEAPEVAHLEYIKTKRGTRLLVSGWWGMARKINYLADFLMGLSWCMLCGFDSIVPYYYAIYFAILLIHRSIRDDHACRQKYGADWDVYKKHVPYRFIPYVV